MKRQVIRMRKKPVRPICPSCGSGNIARILWGKPLFTKELEEQLERKEVVLGGCCPDGTDPAWSCNDCQTRFGDAFAKDVSKIELLAPAGTYETFRAVLRAGADAVYFGGTDFGARAYAGNLTRDEILAALDEAHLFGARIYLTVNTLVKNRELAALPDFLAPFYEAGLDGCIVQDLGAADLIRRELPGMEIHASTQMNVTDEYHAEYLKRFGVTRIVPARELSLSEVRQIRERTGLEIECFGHGALCYSYSGECLMSSFIGGRSGNRGRCAQTCRLPFSVGGREGTWLSRRDLCTLDILPEIIGAGVDSLKIEGRMRSPEYAAGVTAVYRKYIDRYYEALSGAAGPADHAGPAADSGWQIDPADRRLTELLFYRGETTTGYDVFSAAEHCAKKHAVILPEKAAPLPQAEKKACEERVAVRFVGDHAEEQRKLPVGVYASLFAGCPAVMTLFCGETSVSAEGPEVQAAKNRPLTREEAADRLTRFGGTPFTAEQVTVDTDDGIFLPNGVMNALRREAAERLRGELLRGFRRKLPERAGFEAFRFEKHACGRPLASAAVRTAEQARAALEAGADRICAEADALPADALREIAEMCRGEHAPTETAAEFVIALPRIFRQEGLAQFESRFARFEALHPDGWLVRTMGELEYLDTHGASGKRIADSHCYVFNDLAAHVLAEAGADEVTYSLELNAGELAHLAAAGEDGAALPCILEVYGRAPLMLSANCVRGDAAAAGGSLSCPGDRGFTALTDRKGAKLPVESFCGSGYSVILNSVPTYLADLTEEIARIAPAVLSAVFTDEDGPACARVMRQVAALRGAGGALPPEEVLKGGFTRGHFRRGVE